MKFSVVAASAACFAGAFAAPVEKRQVGQVLTIVQSLYDQVTQYTGAINSTLSAVNLPVADGVKDQVTNQVAGQLKSVTSLIDSLLDKTKVREPLPICARPNTDPFSTNRTSQT